MKKSEHLTWSAIVTAIETPAELAPEQRRHLDQCAHCDRALGQARELLLGLSSTRELLGESTVEETLVAETLERLREAWHRGTAADHANAGTAADLLDALRQSAEGLVAQLVADSWRPQPGLRGADTASPRLLRFEKDGYLITLSLIPAAGGDGLSIMGQVIPPGGARIAEDARAHATEGSTTRSATVTMHGEFILKELTRALTEITIEVSGKLIRLPIPPRG